MAQQLDVRYVSYYTAGSSALKLTPAIPLKTWTLPRKKRATKLVLRVDPVAYAGILLAAVMVVLLVVGFVQLNHARQDEVAMAAYVASLEQENAELKATFENSYDLEQVEEVALALGMVPADQLQKITIKMPEPVENVEPSGLNAFWTTITSLFA